MTRGERISKVDHLSESKLMWIGSWWWFASNEVEIQKEGIWERSWRWDSVHSFWLKCESVFEIVVWSIRFLPDVLLISSLLLFPSKSEIRYEFDTWSMILIIYYEIHDVRWWLWWEGMKRTSTLLLNPPSDLSLVFLFIWISLCINSLYFSSRIIHDDDDVDDDILCELSFLFCSSSH